MSLENSSHAMVGYIGGGVIFYCLKFIFMFLNGSVTEREREVFNPLSHSSDECDNQGSPRNLFNVSHMAVRAPVRAFPLLFSQLHYQVAGLKVEQLGLEVVLMWDAGTASSLPTLLQRHPQ